MTTLRSVRPVLSALAALAVSGGWLAVALSSVNPSVDNAKSCVQAAAVGDRRAEAEPCVRALTDKVARNPYDGSALAALARAKSAGGDGRAAEAFAKQAVAVDGANRLALTQLFATALLERNDALAIDCMDRLLRTAPELGPDLAFQVALRLDQPALRRALTRRLHREPPWKDAFVLRLARTARAADLSALLFTMAADQPGLPDPALTPVLQRLLRGGHIASLKAYFAKARTGGPRRAGELVRDPGFEQDPATTAMGWAIDPAPGAQVRHYGATGSDSGGLALQSDLFSSSRPLASQLIFGEQGRVQVEVVARTAGAGDSGDFEVALRCDRGAALGRRPIAVGQTEWTVSRASFDVPENCPVQLLAIVARNSDIRSSAAIEIDSISARNVTGPAS